MRIGFDIGGSKLAVIALDERGAELGRDRCPVPRDYRGTLDALIGMSEALARWRRPRYGALGRHRPSGHDRRGRRAACAWSICHGSKAMPLRADLQRALGLPVAIANDANCFALSEAIDGAAAGAAVVFGVILGTGVGGGIVVDGKVIAGANAIAGEWGHNPLPDPGADAGPPQTCGCGRLGCIETLAERCGTRARLSREQRTRQVGGRGRPPGCGRRS